MVAAVTRLITNRCLTTRSALAKAASVAALSPKSCTKPILSGQSSHTRGAPSALASAVDTTAGGGSAATAGKTAGGLGPGKTSPPPKRAQAAAPRHPALTKPGEREPELG